jgi:hypothetical protein
MRTGTLCILIAIVQFSWAFPHLRFANQSYTTAGGQFRVQYSFNYNPQAYSTQGTTIFVTPDKDGEVISSGFQIDFITNTNETEYVQIYTREDTGFPPTTGTIAGVTYNFTIQYLLRDIQNDIFGLKESLTFIFPTVDINCLNLETVGVYFSHEVDYTIYPRSTPSGTAWNFCEDEYSFQLDYIPETNNGQAQGRVIIFYSETDTLQVIAFSDSDGSPLQEQYDNDQTLVDCHTIFSTCQGQIVAGMAESYSKLRLGNPNSNYDNSLYFGNIFNTGPGHENIIFTGYGKGGVEAVYAALDAVQWAATHNVQRQYLYRVITFGAQAVGDQAFVDYWNSVMDGSAQSELWAINVVHYDSNNAVDPHVVKFSSNLKHAGVQSKYVDDAVCVGDCSNLHLMYDGDYQGISGGVINKGYYFSSTLSSATQGGSDFKFVTHFPGRPGSATSSPTHSRSLTPTLSKPAVPSVTPSKTGTPTKSSSVIPPSNSASRTNTPPPTTSATNTPPPSASRTGTVSAGAPPSNSGSRSASNIPLSNSATRSASSSASRSPSSQGPISNSATQSRTTTPGVPPSNSASRSRTSTPASNSATRSRTNTPGAPPSNSPSRTSTPQVQGSNSATRSKTNTPGAPASNSATRSRTNTPGAPASNSATRSRTNTPGAPASNSPSRTSTPQVQGSNTASRSRTNTPGAPASNSASRSRSSQGQVATKTATSTPAVNSNSKTRSVTPSNQSQSDTDSRDKTSILTSFLTSTTFDSSRKVFSSESVSSIVSVPTWVFVLVLFVSMLGVCLQ